jgi:hypothetical protein
MVKKLIVLNIVYRKIDIVLAFLANKRDTIVYIYIIKCFRKRNKRYFVNIKIIYLVSNSLYRRILLLEPLSLAFEKYIFGEIYRF